MSHLADASDISRMPVTVSIIIEGIGVRELFSRFYSTVSVLWRIYRRQQQQQGGDVDDISNIIVLCLRHRLRKDPLESIDSGAKVRKIFNEVFEI